MIDSLVYWPTLSSRSIHATALLTVKLQNGFNSLYVGRSTMSEAFEGRERSSRAPFTSEKNAWVNQYKRVTSLQKNETASAIIRDSSARRGVGTKAEAGRNRLDQLARKTLSFLALIVVSELAVANVWSGPEKSLTVTNGDDYLFPDNGGGDITRRDKSGWYGLNAGYVDPGFGGLDPDDGNLNLGYIYFNCSRKAIITLYYKASWNSATNVVRFSAFQAPNNAYDLKGRVRYIAFKVKSVDGLDVTCKTNWLIDAP